MRSKNKMQMRLALGVAFLALCAVVGYQEWSPTSTPKKPRTSGLFGRFDTDDNGVARLDEVPLDMRPQFEFLLVKAGQEELGALTEPQFQRALRAPGSPEQSSDSKLSNEATQEPGPDIAADLAKPSETDSTPPSQTPMRPSSHRTVAGDIFSDLDTDGDGTLSLDEFKEIRLGQLLAPSKQTQSKSDFSLKGDTVSPIEPNPNKPLSPVIDQHTVVSPSYSQRQLFHQLDQNVDGLLALRELPTDFRADLLRGDRDNDGRLSLVEFCFGLKLAANPGPADVTVTGTRSAN